MLRQISLNIQSDSLKIDEKISAEFEQNEWNCLNSYYKYANELWDTNFIQKTGNSKFNISTSRDSGLQTKIKLPPRDDVVVFLHRLRPFVLHKEYTSFNKIRGILGRRFESETFRTFLKQQNNVYTGNRLKNQVNIKMKDIDLISEQTLKDWLNSYEYHKDPEIRKKIKELELSLNPDFFRFIMLMLLTEKARAIFELTNIIQRILCANKTSKITFNF